MKRKLSIILLYDVPDPKQLSEDHATRIQNDPDYEDEKDVLQALKKLGHQVTLFPICDQLESIITELTSKKYDLIFTMFESFSHTRGLAPHLTSLFKVINIPYTGANPETLNLCKDKGLSKKILSYHGVCVPKFITCDTGTKVSDFEAMPFPMIIKPLGLDASEGISSLSLVRSPKEALARAQYLRKRYSVDAIAEEYIEGREMYIGMLAGKEPTIFPPQELHFKKTKKNTPKILTFKAKWDETYRSKYGIDSGKPHKIDKDLKQRIEDFGKTIASALNISGYARIDFRVHKDGGIYFLEANPNPAIKRRDDFPEGAKQAGVSYEELIEKIVKSGLAA